MNLLYEKREEEDKKFIFTVCDDILSAKHKDKPPGEDYAAIFVEGRDRKCCLEDLAAISSVKLHSRYNYPVFCFLNNPDFFSECKESALKEARIQIIPIREITSLEEYTQFCIKELYHLLPDWVDKVVTIQPDGMFLKSGWEDYIEKANVDWLSPHWRHMAGIDIKNAATNFEWVRAYGFLTAIGNGGFSFRRAPLLKQISSIYWEQVHSPQRERGRDDDRLPMEDLFYCYWGFNTHIMKRPSLRQCDEFAQDPLTPEIYFGGNKPFGFHFFKDLSQPDWPPCNHG